MDSNPPLSSTYKTLFANHPQLLDPSRIGAAECNLPIIDLRDLTKWGFFQVINYGISHDLLFQLRKFQINLFREPFEKKKKEKLLELAPENYCWGTPSATNVEQLSWSEAYHIPLNSISESVGDNMRKIIQDVSNSMSRLAHEMASILGAELGDMNGNYMKQNCTCNTCYLRLNHYPPCQEPNGAFGLAPHTDSDFLTVLYQDQIGGLQLMKEGRWVNVRPNPRALIINIGDLFQAWSNNLYKSVKHRVVANSRFERFSVAHLSEGEPPGLEPENLFEQEEEKRRSETQANNQHKTTPTYI
ncbi:gibberellin 2-beta-dioxygenase 8-like protein [Carex littledalei]|uniref:Gibberellin 2-beta-dioxygenase 8-like protein n=1 Tax=Carex littledalei TaxID=544730 RepID=A0A833VBV1_9POAL|nr:gibberellin 2-beta-dioxygenase 8-like protein [Carex littledalei]